MNIVSVPIVHQPERARLPLGLVVLVRRAGILILGLILIFLPWRQKKVLSETVGLEWNFGNRLIIDRESKPVLVHANEVSEIFSKVIDHPVQTEAAITAEQPSSDVSVIIPTAKVPKPKQKRIARTINNRKTSSDRSSQSEYVNSNDLNDKSKDWTLLSSIRSDPERSALDTEFITGDLIWTAKNLSPDRGLEIWVQNNRFARNTYYVPRVNVDGIETSFDCNVLAPGAKGVAAVPFKTKERKSITVSVQATGLASRKWRIDLP